MNKTTDGEPGYLRILVLLLALLALLLIGSLLWSQQPAADELRKVRVTCGTLTLKVLERGLVAPARVEHIKSSISSNQAMLVWLREEGSVVDAGELVARFDTKPFMDKLEQLEQQVADLEATLAATEKAVAMKKLTLQGRVEAARRRIDIARIKEDDLSNGSGPLRQETLQQAIDQSSRNLVMLQTLMDDMEMLLDKGHISRRERDRAAADLAAAREKLELSRAEQHNFTTYEWPRLKHEARLVSIAATEELAQEKLTLELQSQRAEGELVKLRRDVAAVQQRRDAARQDVINCEVRAPIAGTLFYREIPRNDGLRKVQIGDAIWHGQGFMAIPDTSAMVIEVNIAEIDIAKIEVGDRADIRLDALPKERFSGIVEFIDSLARDEKNQGTRTFRTRIALTQGSARIYPGMSASVEILYAELSDALLLPVEALTFDAKGARVRLQKNTQEYVVDVTLGAMTDGQAVILDGLAEGDQVVYDPL